MSGGTTVDPGNATFKDRTLVQNRSESFYFHEELFSRPL